MVNQFYGKTVYIGLDVHKKSFALCAISDGKQVGKASMNSSHEGLLSSIAKYFGGAEIILVKFGTRNVEIKTAEMAGCP